MRALLPKADGTLLFKPSARETYQVLEEKLEVSINGQWTKLKMNLNTQ